MPPKPTSSATAGAGATAPPTEVHRSGHSANVQSVATGTTSTASTANTNGTFSFATMSQRIPPGQKAGPGEAMDFIHYQLNLYSEGKPFLGTYQLLGEGPLQRFQGGAHPPGAPTHLCYT